MDRISYVDYRRRIGTGAAIRIDIPALKILPVTFVEQQRPLDEHLLNSRDS